MKESLYPEVRRQEIVHELGRSGQVTVAGLSQLFDVSEVTIRADLQSLADQNLLVRTHGGAVASSRLPDISLNLRKQLQVQAKDRIGHAGARMVEDGEAIFLDTSSTALALAMNLKSARDVTIITNSLAISQLMLDVSGVTVYMPGGVLQRETASLIGRMGLEELRRFNIRKGFFGAHGLSHPEGLTDVSAAEAEVKQAMVKMCRQVIAVIDSTKWGRAGLASFAALEDLNVVITDHVPTSPLVNVLGNMGVEIIIA
jgi:DeoR family transcriptional regulator of aga operon